MDKLELNVIETLILKEISENSRGNITHEFFGVSLAEFENGLASLKEKNLIFGNNFDSNGSIKEGFKFFSILDRGERYLKTGRI